MHTNHQNGDVSEKNIEMIWFTFLTSLVISTYLISADTMKSTPLDILCNIEKFFR